MSQPVIFISYSHKDKNEKDRLLLQLGVLRREGLINLWSDDRIGAGADWKQEISKAMRTARVAILLISANFLNSDFILGEEVPTLLKRRKSEGLTVFPVIARPCAWKTVDWLTQMNVRPENGRPIWSRESRYVDKELAAIVEEVAAIVKTGPTKAISSKPKIQADSVANESIVKTGSRKAGSRQSVQRSENLYIYGMHDRGGEKLMLVNEQAKGWVLVAEAIGADPNDKVGSNYSDLANKGFGVIVRLNYASGSAGAIPLPEKYPDFAQRVANFVSKSPGARIWIIGNEMNSEGEQPRKPGSNEAAPITPRNYATCYRLCREAIHKVEGHSDDQVIVGAIAPWKGETYYEADPEGKYPANKISGGRNYYPLRDFWGDYIQYFRDMLLAIGPDKCDGIAIHAYTQGTDPNFVFSDEKMRPPYEKYYKHFRTYRDQMEAIPSDFRHLPVYLTEMKGDKAWKDANNGWVQNAYKEINDWNKAGNQQIRAAILYHWSKGDKWTIDGKPWVQADFRKAVACGYQWDPSVSARTDPETVTTATSPTTVIPSVAAGTAPVSTQPPYRTYYSNHNTPTSMPPGQTISVTITMQNVGSLTWPQGGTNPVQLGFQWYDSSLQMLTFPPYTPLRADVPPGEIVTLQAFLRTPDTPGKYGLRWDMFHEGLTWFTNQGDQGLVVGVVNISVPVPAPPPPPFPLLSLLQS